MSARDAAVRAVAEALCRLAHGPGAITRRGGSCELCKVAAKAQIAALATSADVRAGLVAVATDLLYGPNWRAVAPGEAELPAAVVDAVLAALGGVG